MKIKKKAIFLIVAARYTVCEWKSQYIPVIFTAQQRQGYSARNRLSLNATNGIFHGLFQRERKPALIMKLPRALLAVCTFFTQNLQCHNRQLIVIRQAGCAGFLLVSAYKTRSHSCEWVNLLQTVQTIGRFESILLDIALPKVPLKGYRTRNKSGVHSGV